MLHTSDVFPAWGRAPQLRWIQLDTSGVEHVTAHRVWQTNIDITTLGGIAPLPMAEITVMSLLALAHHVPLLDHLRRNRIWPTASDRLATLTSLPVDGATATIVGHGRIGREVARLLLHFRMQVAGVSRRGKDKQFGARLSSDTERSTPESDQVQLCTVEELPDVLPRTDFLIVIVPRSAVMVGLIGSQQLARLKPGACVINVSRGGVVDDSALLTALRSRHIQYAALDVFEEEPVAQDSVWWDEPHTSLSPQVAGLAPRYKDQMLELLSTNVLRYQSVLPLLNRADRASGY